MTPQKPKNDFRCGMVSIIGRPNVGKSTLLNRLVGEKVAIVSNVPQTTRNAIRGIYTDERMQAVFIDTPGLFFGRDKLDAVMRNAAREAAEGTDCIIHLVDTSEPVGKEERDVVENLSMTKVPVILGLNKVDLKGKLIPQYIDLWEEITGKKIQELKNFTMISLSGTTGINIDALYDLIYERLPEGPALYPADTVCDVPQKMAIADVVREKLYGQLREELPHSIAVIVETMEPRKGKTLYISVVVLVERDAHKEIVIGRRGQVLKQAGSEARAELETLLETKVFLELYVKSKKNWRDNESLLQEMGYIS